MRLLLVEDEPLIALDLEAVVHAMGHQVVGAAADATTALLLAAEHRPDAALIDINLRDGRSGVDVCQRLVADYGVRTAFLTGNPEQAPDDLAGALALIEKPYSVELVAKVLRALDAGVCAPLSAGLRLPA